MIAIVDYGMGNLQSVRHSLEYVGAHVTLATRPDQLRAADAIVLPGVGAFGECVRNLRASGLVEALDEEVRHGGKPLLGICVGLQVLARDGTEYGLQPGLGWISGVVRRLDASGVTLKVPHTGWNDISVHAPHPLLAGLQKDCSFYFTHSYHLVPDRDDLLVATCEHGGRVTAAVAYENVFACQFHPEKSQQNGLKLLEKFLRWRP